jgi:hypothetical protein
VWGPLIFVFGWKLRKIQTVFINYLKENYPDRWREVLTIDPYKEKVLFPGFTSLTYSYITKEDLGDENIKKIKASLRKIEIIYFDLFASTRDS